MQCNVCLNSLGDPIYTSASTQALSSLNQVHATPLRVWCCVRCGHLRGEPLPDTQQYYESDYRILIDHDDEDQIYDTQGSRIIYRTEHQLNTLLGKIDLAGDARILDYGCAKAAMPKQLLSRHPQLQFHLFDVTETYRAHWDRLVPGERQATHETPVAWQARFDIVTSFFALEHIPEPRATVAHAAALLKEGGVFYGVVPDTFGNPADFVVLDHVNHFTLESLRHLLALMGFTQIDVDAQAHRGALVFHARKGAAPVALPDTTQVQDKAQQLADYWKQMDTSILATEEAAGETPVAVYGSGFYGAYIAQHLRHPERIQCFLDRSPYQQGKTLHGKPIIAPEQLPAQVRTVYVGLNPMIAKAALSDQPWLAGREMDLKFVGITAD